MTHLFVRFLVLVFALLLVANIVPGVVISDLKSAVVAAFILGFLNATVRPIFLLLTFPVTLLTLGFFIFILNAFIFWLASIFITGFAVNGFVPAFLGSLVVTLISVIANRLLH